MQLALQVLAQAQHLLGAAQHQRAGLGEAQVRAVAFEQLHVETLFQLRDLLADGRLGGMQGTPGLGEAALADDLDEAAELVEFH